MPEGKPEHTLNIRGWNGDRDCLLFDVTNTGHEGETARIAGKKDWQGTVQADFDLDDPPYGLAGGQPNIDAGVRGVIRKYVSPVAQGKFISIGVIIAKVHYESAVESQLKYSFDVKQNKLAGPFTYPAV